MNFQTLPPVDNAKQLLNLAFQKAREKAEGKNMYRQKDMLKTIKQKESLKLDIIKDVLASRINKILRDFPETEKLPSFYLKLMHLTLDFPKFKRSFGAMRWVIDKACFLQKQYVSKINQERNRLKIGKISKEFYGRISSVVKQVDENLKFLEESRRMMKTYPDIKEMFTICLYGFPNVGKTTLLNKLTGTKAEVAAYAFTTKSINAGYFTLDEEKVQVLDVPGTLARTEKMNVIELQAELVLQELANVIIFVFDLSEQGGYNIEKQEELLKKLEKELSKDKKVLIYVSKSDLISTDELNLFKHKHFSLEEIKREILRIKEKSE